MNRDWQGNIGTIFCVTRYKMRFVSKTINRYKVQIKLNSGN